MINSSARNGENKNYIKVQTVPNQCRHLQLTRGHVPLVVVRLCTNFLSSMDGWMDGETVTHRSSCSNRIWRQVSRKSIQIAAKCHHNGLFYDEDRRPSQLRSSNFVPNHGKTLNRRSGMSFFSWVIKFRLGATLDCETENLINSIRPSVLIRLMGIVGDLCMKPKIERMVGIVKFNIL